jgi:hypothetical protein
MASPGRGTGSHGHPRVSGERGLSPFQLAESVRAIPAAAGIRFFLPERLSLQLPYHQTQHRIKPSWHWAFHHLPIPIEK